jgi:hypothetical protein
MHDRLVQTIRYKLQKRVRRLNSADHEHFALLLRLFFQFIDSSALLAGVRDELLARVTVADINSSVDQIISGQAHFGDSEEESAAMGYLLLKKLSENPEDDRIATIGLNYGAHGNGDVYIDMVRTVFLEPFYEYLDEHIDDQQAILYFLRQYKHRSEWFHADRLRKTVEDDTQRGEKKLALDLYEYLHEQGIDFHIEPSSASGEPDLVADQVGKDRVIADAKIYWPERDKGKSYIIKGFHQAYIYACTYNEPCAYLVIYKMCKEALNLLVPASVATFPCLTVNNKTIFFVIVDICDHGASASKRGPLKSVDITETELIQRVEVDLGEVSGG